MEHQNHQGVVRILYTNYQLIAGTGTEQVIKDLSVAFRNRGDEVAIYCPRQGDMAEQIRSHGITVLSELEALPWKPDLIHGHHHVETLEALRAFPTARGLFVCHDAGAWHDYPPRHPRLLAYVAVDLNCRERLEASGILGIRIIGNWVDIHRFHRRDSLPRKPRRALIFSNYAAAGDAVDQIQAACREAGIDCSVIGQGMGNRLEKPEEKLKDFDLVFAKSKCAFEAMATGAAVILHHMNESGTMVTTQNMTGYLPWNFGNRLIARPVRREMILEQINCYDREDALEVADWMRKEANMEKAITAYQNLYGELMKLPLPLETAVPFGLASGRESRNSNPETMSLQPLKLTSMQAISVRVLQTPVRVRPCEKFPVLVEIANHSLDTLHSTGHFPVNISYHWFNAKDEVVIYDGIRTGFNQPVASGDHVTMYIEVAAPEGLGRHGFQVTCVQENVLWFDQLPEPVFVSVKIEIG